MLCTYCDDTGLIKESNDPKYYDVLFDRYSAQFNNQQADEMASKKVGYIKVPCPHCQAGKTAEKVLSYLEENGETPYSKMISDIGADIGKIVLNLVQQKKIKSSECGQLTYMIRK